jgi:glucose 1-dehydrogenase
MSEGLGDPRSREEAHNLGSSGRAGIPEDIVSVAVWLASDASDYIQGATIIVDGGMCLYPGFATNG